jgi:hypothetical protein
MSPACPSSPAVPRRALRLAVVAVALAACAEAAALAPAAPPAVEQRAAAAFARVRSDPARLVPFLRQMPKGGDLHNHASGAIYAESYLAWASADGLCVDLQALALGAAPCDAAAGKPPLRSALEQDGSLYDRLVDAWSMRNRDKAPQSGHALFFDSFGRFGPATRGRGGDMLAEVTARAASERLQYVELMLNPDGGGAAQAGRRVGTGDDLDALRAALLAPLPPGTTGAYDVGTLVAQSRGWLDRAEARRSELQHCASAQPDPGCAVELRYVYQVLRALPPAEVFGQLVYAFELARADPRVVGVNLVQPEDAPAALAQFRLEMRMLDRLHALYPEVGITLHAGELAPGLVPPEELRFHVRESVATGHATRIGHGVDVMHEQQPYALLRELARRNVLVEICLTSNATILGVQGDRHPLRTYLAYGVPVALATDDEGVSRSDISGEYLRAVQDQGVGYAELKRMARASLEHAFVEGASLWTGPRMNARVAACARDVPGRGARSAACAAFLASSARARLQMRLEDAYAEFERDVAAGVAPR